MTLTGWAKLKLKVIVLIFQWRFMSLLNIVFYFLTDILYNGLYLTEICQYVFVKKL